MKATLISLNQEEKNRTFRVGEIFRIGRSDDNDLVLPRKYISRRQAMIQFEDGKYVIKDMGSRNPTLINSEPVKEYILQDGDQIEICDFKFRVNIQEDPQQANSQPPMTLDEEDEGDSEGTAFIDMSRFAQEAPKEELGSVDQIQIGGGAEIIEEEEADRENFSSPPDLSTPSLTEPPTYDSPSQQSAGKQNMEAPSSEEEENSFQFDAPEIESAEALSPPDTTEEEESLESPAFDIDPPSFDDEKIEEFEVEFEPETEPEEFEVEFEPEAEPEEFEVEFEPEVEPEEFEVEFEPETERREVDEGGLQFEVEEVEEVEGEEDSFSPEIVDESTYDSQAGEIIDLEGDSSLDIEYSFDAEEEKRSSKSPGEKEKELEGNQQSSTSPMSFADLDDQVPSFDGDDEIEGTAIVDLSAVMAKPPGLPGEEEVEEEEEEEMGNEFTGSLADLIAKKPAAQPAAKEEPEESSFDFDDEEDPWEDDMDQTGPMTAVSPAEDDLSSPGESAIKFMPEGAEAFEDDEDEGTDIVEIEIDTDDDDEGTDIVDPGGGNKHDETAQLEAMGKKKGSKAGKLASAASIEISGDAVEEEEDDDEYYLDPDGTGAFNVEQFMDKKSNEKKIELFTFLGVGAFGLLLAVVVINFISGMGEGGKIVVNKIPLKTGENIKKKWPNGGDNSLTGIKVARVAVGQEAQETQYKGVNLKSKATIDNKHIKVHQVLFNNAAFFIFEPLKPLPEKERFVILLEYNNQPKARMVLEVNKGKPKVDEKKKFYEIINHSQGNLDRCRQSCLDKKDKILEKANPLWAEKKLNGNEGYFKQAIKLFKHAKWIMEVHSPNKFAPKYEEQFRQLTAKIEEAEKEYDNYLDRLKGDFRKLYYRYRKSKLASTKKQALQILKQILNLISDENSPIYMRYELYGKYLFK